MDEKKFMTPRQAAKEWGISYDYCIRLIHDKKIEGAKQFGSKWVIPMETVKYIKDFAPFHSAKK